MSQADKMKVSDDEQNPAPTSVTVETHCLISDRDQEGLIPSELKYHQ